MRLSELRINEGEVVESFSPRDGCDRADSCGVKLPKGKFFMMAPSIIGDREGRIC